MIGIVIVSHSGKVAEGVKDIIDQLNDGQVIVKAVGGADGGRIGTNPLKIKEAIDEIYEKTKKILVFGDLGSSIMGSQMAIDLLDHDDLETVILVDAPLVEGVFAASVQASITENMDEILSAINETKSLNKF